MMLTYTDNKQGSNHGFTLIGVMIALLIAASTGILIVQLMTRAQAITDVGREQFIATNLSREGLELVRQIRDSNWFNSPDDHSTWLARGLCEDSSDDNRQFTVDSDIIITGNDVGDIADAQLYRDETSGIWSHDSTKTVTPYSREISVDCAANENDFAFVQVTSKVSWSSRNKEHEVVIKEKLYNWLP